ncbi:hypothetical protein F25303_4985 [Fusarium sp. NRRL 25303]|nr:hypothetical protein F25303_4985 [Fusarium sp. NRRL 25303]
MDADGVEPLLRAGHEGFRDAGRECHEYQQPGLQDGESRPEAAGVVNADEVTYHTLADVDFAVLIVPASVPPIHEVLQSEPLWTAAGL